MTLLPAAPDARDARTIASPPDFLDCWPVAYPRRHGDWTLADGRGTWGSLNPERLDTVTVEPEADARLPGLAMARRRGGLTAYRIGRRAVVDTGATFIKIVRPQQLDAVAEIHRRVLLDSSQVVVPEVLATSPIGWIELGRLEGRSLHQWLRFDPPGSTLAAIIDEIARSVRALHATPVTVRDRRRRSDDPWEWIDIVSRCEPQAVGDLTRVAHALPALPTAGDALVHGDLHDKNILTTPTGVGLIDLDGTGLGAVEDDIANLAVHIQLRTLQAGADPRHGVECGKRLYRCYSEAGALDPDRLRAAERHTWFRLACLYRFRRHSRWLTPELLRRAAGSEE